MGGGGWGYSGLVRSKVYKFSMRCSNSGVGRARPNLKFSMRSSNFESDQPRFSPPRIGTSHGELTCRNIGFDQSKNLTNPEYPPSPNGLLIEKLDKIRPVCVDTRQSGNYSPHLAMLYLQFSTLNQPLHPLNFLCENM